MDVSLNWAAMWQQEWTSALGTPEPPGLGFDGILWGVGGGQDLDTREGKHSHPLVLHAHHWGSGLLAHFWLQDTWLQYGKFRQHSLSTYYKSGTLHFVLLAPLIFTQAYGKGVTTPPPILKLRFGEFNQLHPEHLLWAVSQGTVGENWL